MTARQLEQIAALRQQNYPYSFIGRELALSPNTVKSICRRKGFTTVGSRKNKQEKTTAVLCRNCRKPLPIVGAMLFSAVNPAGRSGGAATEKSSRNSLDCSRKESDEWC